MSNGFRYLVFSEPAGGYLGEVELTGVTISRSLSGPGRLTGALRGPLNALEWLKPYACSIWAEDPGGTIRGGGLLTPLAVAEGGVQIDAVGFSSFPQGQPWISPEVEFYETDPLDIVRYVWTVMQALPGGNLGVKVDATTSNARVGIKGWWVNPDGVITYTPPPADQWDGPQPPTGWEWVEDKPVHLDWWSTHDAGKVIDELASECGFEYREDDAWNVDKTRIEHRLRLGVPTVGASKTGAYAPRFALGENVALVPDLVADDSEYATGALLLGAGEGKKMIHGSLDADWHGQGVRRVVVLSDQSRDTEESLSAWGRNHLAVMDGQPKPRNLNLVVNDNAAYGTFDVGDLIYVSGSAGFVTLDRWVRIVEMSYSPDSTASLQLSVEEC